MNVFNVHSNRSPVDGAVKKRWYRPRRVRQRRARQGLARQRAQRAVAAHATRAQDVTCVQVAGLIARRILCYVDAGRRARARRSASASSASARASTCTCRSRREVKARSATRCTLRKRVLAELKPMPNGEPASTRGTAAVGTRPWRARHRAAAHARGIYLLPNLFTTGVLFGGFYAIVQAMNHALRDRGGRDLRRHGARRPGRARRALTRTQSEFGAQYDSLADMVAFGAAPALVVYEWALKAARRGSAGSPPSSYCAAPALRLARFNVNIAVVDKRYFQGLPSPAAAALVAGFVWCAGRLRSPARRLPAARGSPAAVDGLRRRDHGLERAVLQLQGHQLAPRVPFWAMLVIVLGLILVREPAAGAVRALRRLRPVGVRDVAVEAPAGPRRPDLKAGGPCRAPPVAAIVLAMPRQAQPLTLLLLRSLLLGLLLRLAR